MTYKPIIEKIWYKPFIMACLVLFSLPSMLGAQDVFINEVMSSNASAFHDEDGDYEDWIELYNPGPEAMELVGYGLSDDYDDPFKWTFPGVVIEPEDYLLVWASGKNRSDHGFPLHAGFRISQSGEEILLTHPDGSRLDELAPIFIPTDFSYGRMPDGSDKWFYFADPTPGGPNITEGFGQILQPPVFSKESGFYEEEFKLNLSHEDPGVTIIYTLDGSAPSAENLGSSTYYYKNRYPQNPGDPFGELIAGSFRSMVYKGDLAISDRSGDPDRLTGISSTWHAEPDYFPEELVFKGTVVRAIAKKDGALSSPEHTAVFFVSKEGNKRYTLPVFSLSTDESNLFDYNDGIYVAGADFDNWRLNNPLADYPFAVYNAMRRGERWEYPAHLTFMDQEGDILLDQNIGFRIHGGWTRSYPAKSLRLYARNKYSKSHFDHPVFGDNNFDEYKRLLLRNSGQDWKWTMFRDAAIQRMVKDLHIDTQACRTVILFINGEYWGIKNLRERYDKHYLARNYGVDKESVDILELEGRVVEGDDTHYNSMLDYLEEHSMADSIHYSYIRTQMDLDNFIDYQIANIFSANTDWPDRNVLYWRLRTDQFMPEAPRGQDGRWRWLLFDMDAGFGSWSHVSFNTLSHAADPEHGRGSLIMRELMDSDIFRVSFINRFADLLNTAFLPGRTTGIINEMKQVIEPEIEEHIARWSNPASKEEWEHYIVDMLEFAKERESHQRNHILDFFGLEGLVNVRLDVNNELMGHIRINTIDIHKATAGLGEHPYPWEGKYFKGVPVQVEAVPAPGYSFSHWQGKVSSDTIALTLGTDSDIYMEAHFEKADEPVLIHYWVFDTAIPNDTPLKILGSSYGAVADGRIEYRSALEGYPYYEGHPLWRKASMERRNSPTDINYRPTGNSGIPYDEADMRGLQVRQPFAGSEGENTMILHLPATGFTDIMLRFAAKDEGAADRLKIDYQTSDNSDNWVSSGLATQELSLDENYQLFLIDFSNIEGVENNPSFRVRIRFDGTDMHADEGNRVTFNNISLDGRSLDAHNIYASAGEKGNIFPSGRIPVYDNADMEFQVVPAENHRIDKFWVDGFNMTDSLQVNEDGSANYNLFKIRSSHQLHASFLRNWDNEEDNEEIVIIYPNPARDNVHIASQEPVKGITIYNIAGQVVFRDDSVNSDTYSVNTNSFGNGLFIMIIRMAEGPVTKKLQVFH